MHADKLRITDSNGLVPAGQYFKLLASALREANARDRAEPQISSNMRSGSSRPSLTRTRNVTASLPSTMR